MMKEQIATRVEHLMPLKEKDRVAILDMSRPGTWTKTGVIVEVLKNLYTSLL
jgi:hypothetical protein